MIETSRFGISNAIAVRMTCRLGKPNRHSSPIGIRIQDLLNNSQQAKQAVAGLEQMTPCQVWALRTIKERR
jgi:hypothetical protein